MSAVVLQFWQLSSILAMDPDLVVEAHFMCALCAVLNGLHHRYGASLGVSKTF